MDHTETIKFARALGFLKTMERSEKRAFSLVFWVPHGFLSVYQKGTSKGFGHVVCCAQGTLFHAILLLLFPQFRFYFL